ncbi:single-stranded-DNA-specific exonuclease RecJ [Flagellatimonas centrodinii]|uniref:single-stranded-DNA-specific exonuclease RecJ n=1 Tax=Flagellatimonas centrodinii TaxID=2806210 RepID=UPI003F4F9C29
MRRRPPPAPAALAGLPDTLHPLVRQLYAARGAKTVIDAELPLAALAPPHLRGLATAVAVLADTLAQGHRIVLAGDYDCDGATGVAVGVRGLRLLGAADVDYVVPDRFRMGYGLSPLLVDAAVARGARLIVTVDSGIASLDGVAHARALGVPVIVTDHHLPGPELPAAAAIVNPNQPGCEFPSRHLAGVGVMFYLLAALRAHLRGLGQTLPSLSPLLDLVALGTVADVVRLDTNNRVLVAAGLRRMRAGQMHEGLRALLRVAGREPQHLTSQELGFVLGPRLNAAGRLDDIRTGIECLLSDDSLQAEALAQQLDRINRERRHIEADMRDSALRISAEATATGLCLFQPDWHEGIVGLVASRIKDLHHRPVIAAARAQQRGMLKASGRTIPGLHLRDVLAEIDTAHPGLIERFGGHAMAAGMSLPEANWPAFSAAFDAACAAHLDDDALQAVIESDGELPGAWLDLEAALALEAAGPWGQGFPEPQFDGRFAVQAVKFMGSAQQHLRYTLSHPDGGMVEAVHFGAGDAALAAGQTARFVYRLGVNRWQQRVTPQLMVVHVDPAST